MDKNYNSSIINCSLFKYIKHLPNPCPALKNTHKFIMMIQVLFQHSLLKLIKAKANNKTNNKVEVMHKILITQIINNLSSQEAKANYNQSQRV